MLVVETIEKWLADLQFQAKVDTFRGIAEFDLSASKDGSVNFLKRVLRLGREIWKVIRLFTSPKIFPVMAESFPRKQIPITFVFTKFVTYLPCDLDCKINRVVKQLDFAKEL